MWNNSSALKKELVVLEKFKTSIMKQINMINANDKAISPTKVYPVSDVKPLQINGCPVIQIRYEGVLPTYIEKEQAYEQAICDYYFHATMCAYDFEGMEDFFDEALILFCHYFSDGIIRDLDNRNSKYIIDALRHSRIIADDNWKVVSKFDIAFNSDEDSLYVYVVDIANSPAFIKELLYNHESFKTLEYPVINKDEFIEKRIKEINKENEMKRKKELEKLIEEHEFWS